MPAFLLPFLIGELKVEKHDHARFRIKTGKGNNTYPNSDAHVVIEEVEEPEGPDQGERNSEQDDNGFENRLRVQVDKHEDDQSGERDYQFKPLMGLDQILVFAAPDQPVALRDLEGGDALFGLLHVATDIAA